MSDGNPDVMDTLAGLPDGSAIAELRRQRPDVVRHLQGSDDAIFAPAHHGGFTRPEREAAASRVAITTGRRSGASARMAASSSTAAWAIPMLTPTRISVPPTANG